MNAFVSGQFFHGNGFGLAAQGAHCTVVGGQSDIIAQDVGGPLRLNVAAAFRVHHLFADSVKHHVLGPFKLAIPRRSLICQVLICVVRCQIGLCISVLRVLVSGSIRLQIIIRGFVSAVIGIIFISLVVGIALFFQRLNLALRKFVVSCLTFKIGLIVALGIILISSVIAIALFLQLLTLCLRKPFMVSLFVKIGLIRSLLLCVVGLPLGLCFAALVGIISRFHIRLVVVTALLQSRNVGAFIGIVPLFVLFAVDQSGVNPAMYHFVHAIRGLGGRICRKRVDETAVIDPQVHVAFLGLNPPYSHIAAGVNLLQIDPAFGAGVHLGAVTIRTIYQIRAGNPD